MILLCTVLHMYVDLLNVTSFNSSCLWIVATVYYILMATDGVYRESTNRHDLCFSLHTTEDLQNLAKRLCSKLPNFVLLNVFYLLACIYYARIIGHVKI